MSTYNAYSNRQTEVGGSIPVWLGVVSPIPVGGKLASAFANPGAFIPAGTPMELKAGVATPFSGYLVKAYTTASTDSVITVVPFGGAAAPTTSLMLQKVGATFGATGKAWNPDAVEVNSEDNTAFDITVATANIDVVAQGDVIAISSSDAEGSSKSLKVQPTHYLYNDVAIDPLVPGQTASNVQASVALVNFHGEGILINRTPASVVKVQMKAAVPNVIQDERF